MIVFTDSSTPLGMTPAIPAYNERSGLEPFIYRLNFKRVRIVIGGMPPPARGCLPSGRRGPPVTISPF